MRAPAVRGPARLLAAGLIVAAVAAPARDLADGWILPAAWETALADGAASPGPPPRLSCGVGRLFDMPELTLRSLGGCMSLAGLDVRADWQILGATAWREQTWRVEATGGRRAGMGVAWLGRRVETPQAPVWSRAEAALVLRLHPAAGWEAVVWSDPVSLTPGREASAFSPWLRLRGVAGGAAWAIQVDRRAHAAPRWRLGLAHRVCSGVVLGALGDAGTGTLGVTSLWRRGSLAVRTSHLIHPALGVTHRWMLLLGGTAP